MNAQTNMRKKAIASPASGGDPLVYVLSDETPDRAGDIIKVSGWDLSNFLKNPIALFGHNHHFVIGHWTDVKVRGKQLIGRLNLLPKGVSERLDELRAAVSAGVLRSISVGFLPDHGAAEPNKHGGYTFGSAELTEASLVAVGMNPNALQLAKSLNLSADARALIFGDVRGANRRSSNPVVRLDRPAGAARVVRLDPVVRAAQAGTLKIHAARKWRVGDPIRITKTGVRVVKLDPQFRPPQEPRGPLPVVKLTDRDRTRAKHHRAVRLRDR